VNVKLEGILYLGLVSSLFALSSKPVIAADNRMTPANEIVEQHNCVTCHGEDGISLNNEWPNLAGQNYESLRNELKDFRAGKRTNPLMSPMANPLTDAQIDAVAGYYSNLPQVNASGAHPLVRDESQYKEATLLANVLCITCHGPQGITPKGDWPNLAGQKSGYLLNQLRNFRSRVRWGEFMSATVHLLKETELAMLADYYSGLPGCSDTAVPATVACHPKATTSYGKIEKIEGGLYTYSFDTWKPMFLTSSKGVIMFDPISVPLAQDLKNKLSKMGLKVRYVVLTHAHEDHCSGASVFADEAVVISSEETKKRIAQRNFREEIAARKAGRTPHLETLPSVTFTDRMVLSIGGEIIELESVEDYSHSVGDVVLVNLPKYKILEAVDSVTPGVLGFTDFRATPLLKLLDNARGFERRDFAYLSNGHSIMPKSSVVEFREYLEFLVAIIDKAIADGKSVDEVRDSIHLPAQFLPLALSIYPPNIPDAVKMQSLETRFMFNLDGAFDQLKAKMEGHAVTDIHNADMEVSGAMEE
jgi:cytochrome c553/glyoxylase-like metal-dependent hydrolase (beta-lactamase superfamily II)